MADAGQTATTPIANTEMAAVWDGEEGDEWTENAERYEATDRWLAARFEREVAIGAHDHVLDVGCGTGRSTRDAARRAPHGSATGVDLSTRMLAYAQQRCASEGLTNVRFVRADAQVHPFPREAYDLVVSDFGAMFFNDPAAAFTNLAAATRPGGRLALLSWQRFERNEWLTVIFEALACGRSLPTPPAGTPGPFGLADPDAIRALLTTSGWRDIGIDGVLEPMWLGSDADEAWAFVSAMGLVRGLTEGLAEPDRRGALDVLRARLADHHTAEGVTIGSAAWLVTAERRGAAE